MKQSQKTGPYILTTPFIRISSTTFVNSPRPLVKRARKLSLDRRNYRKLTAKKCVSRSAESVGVH